MHDRNLLWNKLEASFEGVTFEFALMHCQLPSHERSIYVSHLS